jgi:[acyl-carrier-protein] S-malonyltransferase
MGNFINDKNDKDLNMQFAAVFPGQGSQSLGMLSELADNFPEVKNTFDEGSDILGKDLWKLTTEESGSELLNQTENTQPVMLAAGVSMWRLWQSQGGCQPIGMAGHSLGEYSALVASGVIDFKSTVKLVGERARFMQQAVPEGTGAMAAILGLEDNVIVSICNDISAASGDENKIVEAVNFNSPGQVVIAGEASTVDVAIDKLREACAKRAIKLAVSVPSHCSLMKGAADKLSRALAATTFIVSKNPVLQNVEAKNYDSDEARRNSLTEQLYKPVRWVDTINNLEHEYGAETIIEFGPGKVLFGLNRRINRNLGNICISDLASLDKALAACNA